MKRQKSPTKSPSTPTAAPPEPSRILPAVQNDMGFCPYCADPTVVVPFRGRKKPGLTFMCSSCRVREFIYANASTQRGLLNYRTLQRALFDESGRAAYIEFLLSYQRPRSIEIERRIPGYDLVAVGGGEGLA